MTDTVASARPLAEAGSRYFYFYMALVCMAVAFLGFTPTYWVPMAAGRLNVAPVIHIHGLLFFAWTIYYAFQTWLAASGQLVRHRNVGLIGVSLAAAMLIFGLIGAIHSLGLQDVAGNRFAGEAFAIISVSTIAAFAALIALALANTRRPEWHKRFMLLAAISILGAAVARIFRNFIVHGHPSPANNLPAILTTDLLLLIPLIYDWRTRGRPHPAYIYGACGLVGLHILRVPFSGTPMWHGFAAWLLGLAA